MAFFDDIGTGFAPMFQGIFLMFSIAIAIGIVGVILWYMKKYMLNYPIKVLIFEKRGKAIVPAGMDRARRLRQDEGGVVYRLRKRKMDLEPVDFKFIYPGNWLFLFSASSGAYSPMEITDAVIKAIPADVKFWQVLEQRRALARTDMTTLWQKYLPYVFILIFVVAVGFALMLMWTGLSDFTGAMNANSAQLKEASQILADAIKASQGVSTPSPIIEAPF